MRIGRSDIRTTWAISQSKAAYFSEPDLWEKCISSNYSSLSTKACNVTFACWTGSNSLCMADSIYVIFLIQQIWSEAFGLVKTSSVRHWHSGRFSSGFLFLDFVSIDLHQDVSERLAAKSILSVCPHRHFSLHPSLMPLTLKWPQIDLKFIFAEPGGRRHRRIENRAKCPTLYRIKGTLRFILLLKSVKPFVC